MRDAGGVRGRHSPGKLHRDIEQLFRRDRSALDHGFERFARDQFADDIKAVLFGANIEHAYDVGVVECGSSARLLLEPGAALGIIRKRGWQNLQRYIASQPSIVCAIHLPHSARAKQGNDFVWTELVASGEPHNQDCD